jgi:superfamily II DNA or RNA helicase
MSCKIPIVSLTDDQKEKIDDELRIELEVSSFASGPFGSSTPKKYIYPYEIVDEDVFLPFYYAYNNINQKRPKRIKQAKINLDFIFNLREEQKEVKKEAIDILNKKGSVLLALACAFGKTFTSTYIACKIGLKTLVIVNKVVLMKQWKESILKTCPDAKIQLLTSKSPLKDCDFYIINAINVPKLDPEYYKHIQTLIVDECHLIMAELLSKCMQHVFPRYLIGLSATPYRPDGLTKLLDLYFGQYKIIRELYRYHIVYKVNTGFKPKVELTKAGKVNWGSILDSQANDPDRNEMIIQIVKDHPDRAFLILVKRITQGEHLLQRLEEEGEYVDSLLGKNQEFNTKTRILVGTTSKVGVGFDWPKADALLLAADLQEYFIQYLGRVFRRKDMTPIIFDIVDDNRILKRHYTTRSKVYKKHGGEIKIYKL